MFRKLLVYFGGVWNYNALEYGSVDLDSSSVCGRGSGPATYCLKSILLQEKQTLRLLLL